MLGNMLVLDFNSIKINKGEIAQSLLDIDEK